MSLVSIFKRNGPNGLGFSSTAEDVTDGLELIGKTVLITGVNSGLGLETARVLSSKGATVVGLARTLNKAESISPILNNSYFPMACELSEPRSVLDCVEILKNSKVLLDAIICNAGIMALPKLQQKYGVELQFLTNHIGHFMLVEGLIDSLNEFGRITIVSSLAHKMFSYRDGIQFRDFSGAQNYDPHKAYGHSKLANLLFCNELSRRLKATTLVSNAIHPGVIHTNLLRHYNPFIRYGMRIADKIFLKTVEQGAATQCYVSVHPDVEGMSGNYFSDCNLEQPSAHAQDKVMAKRLWDVSENIVSTIEKDKIWQDG